MNEAERYADLSRKRQESYKSVQPLISSVGGYNLLETKVEMCYNNLILSTKKTKRVFQFQSGLLILAHKFQVIRTLSGEKLSKIIMVNFNKKEI